MTYFTPAFVHTSTGVMPAWMPTQALFNDVREWDVSVAPHGTTLQRPLIPSAILNRPSRIRVNLYRILLEAGMAFTRGVGQPPLSPSSLAPLYRYIDLFVGTGPNLRMIGGVKDADPRFKQLIAEEVSLGIACYILREHMDVIHISDFEPLLYPPKGIQPIVEFVPGHTDAKRPDFYCETLLGEVVLAESKGVVGPRFKMVGPLSQGKHQVNNVRPRTAVVRANCGRVVIGTNLQVNLPRMRSDSMTHILDPTVEGRESLEQESDMAVRISYAKILRYIGLNAAARLLINRQQWRIVEKFVDLQWNGMSLVPLGYAPIGGLVTVERNVFETLRDGNLQDLRQIVKRYVSQFLDRTNLITSDDGVIILGNGIVVFVTDREQKPEGFPFQLTPVQMSFLYNGMHVCDPEQCG